MEKFNVDDLLGKLMSDMKEEDSTDTLISVFEKRVNELDISQTTAAEIMGIQHRGLVGILNGTLKRVDLSTLVKLSAFLQIPEKKVLELIVNSFKDQLSSDLNLSQEKIDFIQNNFDLATLKKVGFINDITDYNEIEERICELFNIKDVLNYKPTNKIPAFSSGKIIPKNQLNRSIWLTKAEQIILELNNPYAYDRQKLIDFFPKIRWYSTQERLGLKDVISELFKCGLSVIFMPSFPNLHVRGATIPVQGKPAVILTDYKGFYGTLWFALVHELYHVLFDWEEIAQGNFHLSVDEADNSILAQKELDADNFARKYLFGKEKSAAIKKRLNSHHEVIKFAHFNDVHPSMIYLFEAYDSGSKPVNWMRARNYNVDVNISLGKLNSTWDNLDSINQYAKRNMQVYS